MAADPGTVWDVLTAVERWPSWNPDVKSATLDGSLAERGRFRWKAGPSTITSTIERLEPPRFLSWSGRTLGLTAIHEWKLEPKGDGTLVSTEESMEGLAARLLRGSFQKRLEKSLETWLAGLKQEAERRARPG